MDKMKHTYRKGLMKYLFAVTLLAGTVACVDNQEALTPAISDGKEVQVELSFGFDDEEDGYELSGTTRTGVAMAEEQNGAFAVTSNSKMQTRAGEITRPDALYELHVIQYTQTGTLIGSAKYTAGATAIGEKLSFTLAQADDCQLVVVARGEGNTLPSISGTLSNVQKLTMASSIFENIPTENATQAQMNKMPYVLHLPHVNVTSDGKLQSLTGANDARLLLKRLATKLTVNWNLDRNTLAADYLLKEVKLCQIPATFSILPAKEETEWGVTWPSSVAEFIESYRLTDAEGLARGIKTVWIPANVRGNSPKATSPYYRTKENAPTAASYVELVVDNSVKKERLYYRAYLGGEESTDFNLYENKNYNWTLKVSSANYRDDGRIQLLDQTPVESTNLVETSNCFMMQPGTNICFNPYKHEAGTNGWNTYLTNGTTLALDKTIASVKVLWQTKDAGTSGDLVMGYVIDDTHHENLVNVSDIGDMEKARVHVKVPVTNGGNAVIEGKNASGVTVWSWHIWVSEYIPAGVNRNSITSDATRIKAIEAAQKATQGGMVQVYGGISWSNSDGAFYKKVIMDRNLGATKAGMQNSLVDRVCTFGLLYQGGRKDPFFSTADGTTNEVKTIYDGYGQTTKIRKISQKNVPYQTLVANPINFYYPGGGGSLNTDNPSSWDNNRKKTIYDPCPIGWKVPLNEYGSKGSKYSLCAGFGSTNSSTVYESAYGDNDNIMYWDGKNLTSMKNNGGISKNGVDTPGAGFLYFGGSGENINNYTNKSAFFPGVSLRESTSGNYRGSVSNNSVFLWASTSMNTTSRYIYQIQTGQFSFQHAVEDGYGFSVRCIQDNGD